MPKGQKGRKHGTHSLYCGGCRCVLCTGAHARFNKAQGRNRPDLQSKQNRKKSLKEYGIDETIYERILAYQNIVCGICRKPCATGKRLGVDHDHETDEVRGLLCFSCNTKLGWYTKYKLQVDTYLRRSFDGEWEK